MKTKLTLLLFLEVAFFIYRAQSNSFLNSKYILTSINPSFAGSNGLFRDQSIMGYQRYHESAVILNAVNSFDAFIPKIQGGVFLNTYVLNITNKWNKYDTYSIREGEIKTGYAQYLNFFNKKLSIIPSVSFSMRQRKFTFKSENPDIHENLYQPFSKTFNFRSAGAGLLFKYKRLYLGMAINDLLSTEKSGRSPDMHPFVIYASYNLILSEKTIFNFSGRTFMNENYFSSGDRSQFDVNALFFKHLLIGGGAYEEGGYVSLGFRNNVMTVMIVTDGNYLKNSDGNIRGMSELALSYNLRNKENRKLLTNWEAW